MVSDELSDQSWHEIQNLDPSTTYDVFAFACDRGVRETVGQRVAATTLQPMADVRVVEIWDASVVVAWAPVPRATHYRVTTRDPNSGTAPLAEVGAAETQFTIGGMVPGSQYEVCVFAGWNGVFSRQGRLIHATALSHLSVAALARESLERVKRAQSLRSRTLTQTIRGIFAGSSDAATGVDIANLAGRRCSCRGARCAGRCGTA